jgi:lipopolysaccharide transport protein LptA
MAASYPNARANRGPTRCDALTKASPQPRVAHQARFRFWLPAALTVVPTLLHGADGLAAQPNARNQPISVDAASTDVDYKNNSIVLRDVIISQGEIRVEAAEARAAGGLNFENSRWTFSGNVRIKAEGGSLRSQQAVVSFVNNLISRATITGKPAEFEQQRKQSAEPARGRANTIDYETATGTVSLLADAWLSDGRNEIRGQKLIYSIREQRVQAQSTAAQTPGQSDGRVRIIIQPPAPQAKPPATETTSKPPLPDNKTAVPEKQP